jgi:hypothetical protein
MNVSASASAAGSTSAAAAASQSVQAAGGQITAAGPPVWVRWLVTVLVCGHFAAILATVSGASSPNFPAPVPLVKSARLVRPYLQSIFLTNAYRFYAPDPGPTDLLWVRFRFADGSVRWRELPRRADFPLRMPFQRQLALLLLMNLFLEQAPLDLTTVEGATETLAPTSVTQRLRYNAMGRICFRSVVRHLARKAEEAAPERGGVKMMELYRVNHLIITPQQKKLGWRLDDPRLYQVYAVGTYLPNGDRAFENEEVPWKPRYVSGLFAEIVQEDLGRFLAGVDLNDRARLAARLEEFGLPTPMRWPVLEDPSLVKIKSRLDLEKAFDERVEATCERARQEMAARGGRLAVPTSTAPIVTPGRVTAPPSSR